MTDASVVLPTYREAAVVERTLTELRAVAPEAELLIVDDSPDDATIDRARAWARERDDDRLRVLDREGPASLGGAVLDGLRAATGDVVVVMDADLQHPPDAVPALLDAVETGADLAVGTRYADGGDVGDWGLRRRLVSRAAIRLAQVALGPARVLSDPMSGLFAVRQSAVAPALDDGRLDPHGYKVLLEVIAKCEGQVREVPYEFQPRAAGESALTADSYRRFTEHLASLWLWRWHLDGRVDPATVVRSVEVGVVAALALPAIFFGMLVAGAAGHAMTAAAGGSMALALRRLLVAGAGWQSDDVATPGGDPS